MCGPVYACVVIPPVPPTPENERRFGAALIVGAAWIIGIGAEWIIGAEALRHYCGKGPRQCRRLRRRHAGHLHR